MGGPSRRRRRTIPSNNNYFIKMNKTKSLPLQQALQLMLCVVVLLISTSSKAAVSAQTNNENDLIDITDGENIQICYDALNLADADGDGAVRADEYVDVVKNLGTSQDFLEDVTSFFELPLILRSNFYLLACLCLQEPGSTPTCCSGNNAKLSVDGTAGDPTPDEESYLSRVCFLTETSVNRIVSSTGPSVAPTTAPVITNPPSTSAPTPSPSKGPSASPTSAPSSTPSAIPTPAPTVPLPTVSPTISPTQSPTIDCQDRTGTFVLAGSGRVRDCAWVADRPDTRCLDRTDQNELLSTVCPESCNSPCTSSPTPSPTQTFAPSNGPTSSPSVPPTAAPSAVPSASPSSAPSNGPTSTPSASPTVPETPNPSAPPSVSPTLDPTALGSEPPTTSPVPTKAPTDLPSVSPSLRPTTGTPTMNPTQEPSDPPTMTPSVSPTQSPVPTEDITVPPTEELPDQVAKIEFMISVTNGSNDANIRSSSYVGDLSQAMEVLARRVMEEEGLVSGGRKTRHLKMNHRHQQLLRKLQVSVDTPTVDGMIETICPDFVPEEDRCEDIFMSVGIFVDENSGVDDEQALETMSTGLTRAIENKELQGALEEVNPDSPIRIVTGADASDYRLNRVGAATDPPQPDDEGISGAGIAGIVVGSLAGVLVAALLIKYRRSSNESYRKQDDQDLLLVNELEPASDSKAPDSEANAGNRTTTTRTLAVDSTPDTKRTQGAIPYMPMRSPESENNDEESQVTSSGWSSHGGQSSLDTASIDVDEELAAFNRNAAGTNTTLVDIGSGSQHMMQSGDNDDENDIAMTYSELDSAIQKGDWAAVGVTAALLASSAQSVDTKSLRSGGSSERTPQKTTIDAKRAAELDRLVEAGDWEGVVAAAAKYDANPDSHASQSSMSIEGQGGNASVDEQASLLSGASASSKFEELESLVASVKLSKAGSSSVGSVSSQTGSEMSGSATLSRSAYTSGGASNASMAKKKAEYREEIEALVRRVVPEEIDNIDEMMAQFAGREEELVETLRTMQERAIAQKARLAGQKQAKQAAKKSVEASKVSSGEAPISPGTHSKIVADNSWIKEIDDTAQNLRKIGSDSERSDDEEGTMLRAGMLGAPIQESDDVAPVSKSSSKKDNPRWVAANDDGSSASAYSSSTDHSGDKLGDLVEAGDWEGVVKIASKYSGQDSAEDEAARIRRKVRLREEQEALAQADIWSAIAQQTKTEGSEQVTGASDAADWAIARSLKSMVDEKQAKEDPDQASDSMDTSDREV